MPRITSDQASDDTVEVTVVFSDPIFIPTDDRAGGTGSDGTVFALRSRESVYLECAGDRIDVGGTRLERKTDDSSRTVVVTEDVAFGQDGEAEPLMGFIPRSVIETTDLGLSNGKRLFLVRFDPFAESADGTSFRWITRLTCRFAGQGIRFIPANALRSDRVQAGQGLGRISKSTADVYPLDGPALKMWIKGEGLVVLPQTLVVQSGWDISRVNPRDLRVVGINGEIPIRVIGQDDGTFDFTDAVEFYAEPLWNTDKPGEKRLDVYSDKNVFWLTLGQKPGLRMAEIPGWISDDFSNGSYPRSSYYSQHEEQDRDFSRFPGAKPNLMDDAEYWTFTSAPVGGQSVDLLFTLDNPDVYSNHLVEFRLKFRGQPRSNASSTLAQPLDVLINNRLVLSDTWSQNDVYIFESHEFNPAYLFNGLNKLTVVNRSTDGEFSRVYIDWFEIRFPRYYKAVRNSIRFRSSDWFPGQVSPFRIEGFDRPDIDIYKIGSGRLFGQHVTSVTDSLGKTTYTAIFQDQITDESEEYIAVTPDSKILPDRIAFIPRMTLRSPGRGADYIVIAPSDSLGEAALAPWTDLRRKQGYDVEIVQLDTVFNEFNYGLVNPKAIRAFLRYAKTQWNPAPRFVLLVGDCDLNSRTVATGRNAIPSPLYQTLNFGGAASDFWYTLLDADDLPDVAIGRLPVRTRAELETAVGKILQYERSAADPWKNRYLMIGAGSRNDVFGTQSNALIQEYLPYNLHAERMFLVGNPDDSEFGDTEKLIQYLDRGVGWINFRGHGGGAIWADQGLMDLDVARSLQNKDKYPFITSLTCFTGDFSASRLSLGEVLVNQKDGGAIAFLGATSVGWLMTDYYLIQNIIETYKSEPSLGIGEMLQKAKIRFAAKNFNDITQSEMHQYNLIGDPALKLTFPVDLTESVLDRHSYSAFDSLRIAGENSDQSSRILFEITDSQNRVHASTEMTLPPDSWNAVLPIPSGFTGKKAGLRVYTWNEAAGIHKHGYQPFSVQASYFDSLYTMPRIPTFRDSIRIRAFLQDRNPIRSVTCNVFRPIQADLPMVQDSGEDRDRYTTVSSIGPFTPGAELRYSVTVESEIGTSRSDTVSVTIPTLPDLTANFIRLGGTDQVLLLADIYNHGQEPVKSTRLRFEAPESGWSAESTLSVGGNSKATAGVPVDTRIGKAAYRVIVNPDSSQLESDYTNNRYDKEITIDAFNVTPENGSFNGISGPDTVGLVPRGKVTSACCFIPPGTLSQRSVLTMQTEIKIDETMADPESESQVLHRFSLSKFTEGWEAPTDIILVFTMRSGQEAAAFRPYRWNPSISQWISVPYQARDTVFTVLTRSLGLFSLRRNEDDQPPVVEILMENQTFSEGCFVPERPVFSIRLLDPSGIDFRPDKILIILDDQFQPENAYSVPDSVRNPVLVTLSYRPTLTKGPHTMSIRCSDIHGNAAQTGSYGFQVSERFDVQFLGNHPNPFKRETVFVYVLTENADRFSLKLYTVAGKRIRTFESADLTAADYHEVEWDGKDDWGDEVANGVYFFRILTVKGGERREITGKIARVR